MKNPNDPIRDQTHILLASSAVPQQAAPPHTPMYLQYHTILSVQFVMCTVLYIQINHIFSPRLTG